MLLLFFFAFAFCGKSNCVLLFVLSPFLPNGKKCGGVFACLIQNVLLFGVPRKSNKTQHYHYFEFFCFWAKQMFSLAFESTYFPFLILCSELIFMLFACFAFLKGLFFFFCFALNKIILICQVGIPARGTRAR